MFWKAPLLLALLSFAFVLSAISTPPTSYLHSWNQITTLSVTINIFQKPETWLTPQDVVTRISDLRERSLQDDPVTPFIVFEEFPLYSKITALFSPSEGSLIVSGKIMSVFALVILCIATWNLTKRSSESFSRILALSLLLSSFPFLYYGQTTMSDMLMVSLLYSGLFFLDSWVLRKKYLHLILSLLFFTLSTLAKSYSLIFALFFIGFALGKQKRFFLLILSSLVLVAPVLTWHVYAFTQPGHQELVSHSFLGKFQGVLSPQIILTLLKSFFRYFGYIFGALFVWSLFIKTSSRAPWWSLPIGLASFTYLIFTADKISVHDYYFLPIFPALFILAAEKLAAVTEKFPQKKIHFYITGCLLLSFLLCWPKFLKAVKPNPDVLECAALIESQVPEDNFLGTWTDVSRYNSLAYFSKRRAINIEEQAFPLSRYKQAGITYLAVNLPQEIAPSALTWITRQGAQEKKKAILLDAKKRERICVVFELR